MILNKFSVKNNENVEIDKKIDFNSDRNYMAKYLVWNVLIREK